MHHLELQNDDIGIPEPIGFLGTFFITVQENDFDKVLVEFE